MRELRYNQQVHRFTDSIMGGRYQKFSTNEGKKTDEPIKSGSNLDVVYKE
jgi:hypothetical protein